jgi:hypothetical protein
MAKNQTFTPQKMRTLLAFMLFLVVAGGGALFYFGLGMVKNYAVEVNNRLVDAEASTTKLEQLQTLREQLTQNESLITKADRIFISAEGYQVQTLEDLNNYANQTGVTIASTAFDAPNAGVYAIEIQLTNPVNYSNLVQFITLVEGNLPKMQVSSLSLARVEGGSGDTVEVDDFKINTLVR